MIMDERNSSTISRTYFLQTLGLLTAGCLVAPTSIIAQTSPVITIKKAAATTPITVQTLRGNIHVLQGSGGNISVFGGPEGKLMVDAGIAVSKDRILAAMAKFGSEPLKYLISTHWHFDHTGGNEWAHQQGASIIGHEITRKNLMKSIRVVDWDYTFVPLPAGALPTTLFSDEHTLEFNGEKIHMKYYKPAHTDCDISVYFPHADVLHVADTWWNPYYPFIDHNSGGTLDGMITACEWNLKMATPSTIIVPGHGAVGDRSQLAQFRDMLVAVRHNVASLKRQGRSLSDTIKAKPTAAFDQKWGAYVLDGAFFTKLVYADV
jgi:glyoxylase-like metal-dependent hydrolase (beta-lactamase superfamily II)